MQPRTLGQRNAPQRQRGVVAVFLAIGMLAIIGMAGLAIDTSHAFLNKERLQYALDAAVLSGAYTLQTSAGDTPEADEAARRAWVQNLNGELDPAVDEMTLELEYSSTLVPFAPGSAPALFVRARVTDFERPFFLANVLPGVGDQKIIGATSVAGPIPLNGPDAEVCDLAPILVCGDPNDTSTDENTLFGVRFYDAANAGDDEYCLKLNTQPGGNGGDNGNGGGNANADGTTGNGNDNGGGNTIDWEALGCANADALSDLDENADPSAADLSAGNFQLLDFGNGGAGVRDNLAGAGGYCSSIGATVTSEPGNTVGPVRQGFNTRFGQDSTDAYPPDLVTTSPMTYQQYRQAYADEAWTNPAGAPERRVLAVPIVACDDEIVKNGKTDIPVLAIACFFMTSQVPDAGGGTGNNSLIKGVLIKECSLSGTPGTDPDFNTDYGPYKIILYKDPDGDVA